MKKLTIAERLNNTLLDNKMNIKDKKKLKRQQKYYAKLEKNGIAVKQGYDLKPISAI